MLHVTPKSVRSVGSNLQSTLFPQDECLFCGKRCKTAHRSKEPLTKCETETAQNIIKECATDRQDFKLLGKIDGVDMLAKEARYHESCRRNYVRRDDRQHHQTCCSDSVASKTEQKAAYGNAFDVVRQYVEKAVLQSGTVVRMSMLHNMYQQHMERLYPAFYNPDHNLQKLRQKLLVHFGDQLQFWHPQRNCKSDLVFSSDIDLGEAVESAFNSRTSETEILQNAAAILRRDIKDAHSSSTEMPWPPSADFLHSQEAATPPVSLVNFLSQVITGKSTSQASDKSRRLTASVAEDLCSAATQGKWTMPKHVLLGMTVRHLTGRADLLTILNRFGHCQSYARIMELDTALAYQVQKADDVLPSNITVSGNVVAHLCWDNFDINEQTPSGVGTTHTTHGIVIQEVDSSAVEPMECVPQERTRERCFKYTASVLPPCYTKRHVEPTFSQSVLGEDQSEHTDRPFPITHSPRDLMWAICRGLCNNDCTVPDWNGWISMTTASDDTRQSTVGYMRPILHPLTDYATVQECLTKSMQVSKRLDQPFTFITFDYAAARMAYDIVWEKPTLYSNVLVHMGAFHTMCSYMGSLGKMMNGSGFEEILIEAGVCASGSINQVINGSHYNRAMRVHQHMADAIERLLLDRFFTDTPFDLSQLPELVSLAEEPSFNRMVEVMNSTSCSEFMENYSSFQNDVRGGRHGKTAQFWISYYDCVWVLLHFVESIKENDLQLYLQTLRQLCGLMFSADHLNYARYLPAYFTHLKAVTSTNPEAHQLLNKYGISVSRSAVPGCRNAIDMTIEQTINRSAKTAGGIVGFSRNQNAYCRWCLARHKRAMFLEATLEQADMVSDSATMHKTTHAAERKHSERDVKNLVSAFQNFLNPFTLPDHSNDSLFCLSSGKPATADVTHDLLNYASLGDQAAGSFIKDRLVDRTTKFHDPMKKLSLHTFQSMAVSKTQTTDRKKVIRVKAERNLLGQLLLLSKSHDISFNKLFSYPLGPIPWSLATADGSFIKTNKAQLMHHLEDQSPAPVDSAEVANCTVIIDGNAFLRSLVRLPETFGEMAKLVISTLPKGKSVHFVTDSYQPDSIKQAERLRRGTSTTFLIGGPLTKLPKDFSAFMLNAGNKLQLVKFLLNEWKSVHYARYVCDCTVYFVCEEECHMLHSPDVVTTTVSSVQNLWSSQEEADTRIILHCLHAAQSLCDGQKIVVRSPDTDVFILLLAYASRITKPVLFDTGSGNNRRLIDISSIASNLGDQIAEALPGLHAFTGCDCTSAFVRKGKTAPF